MYGGRPRFGGSDNDLCSIGSPVVESATTYRVLLKPSRRKVYWTAHPEFSTTRFWFTLRLVSGYGTTGVIDGDRIDASAKVIQASWKLFFEPVLFVAHP